MKVRELKNLLTDETVDIGDLILAQADLQTLDKGFQEAKIDTPEWVIDKLGEVNRAIVDINRAEFQRKLRAAKARRAALATPDEKRKVLDEEIAQLEKKLSA